MKNFICSRCGHVAFEKAPLACPACNEEKFNQNDGAFTESELRNEEATAKHVPAIVVKKECGMVPNSGCVDILVTVGKVIHPMENIHHITFLDCYVDGQFVARAQFTTHVNPAACFHLKTNGALVVVVAHCNIHGFFMAESAIG